MCEYAVLKYFHMDSGLRRRFNSGFPSSMHIASMLQAKAGFRCTKISSSRLSSANITFWVGPLLLFATTSLLMLSALSCARRWGRLPVSLGSLMVSMMALCFCAIVGRSSEDCKCSYFLQRDCANDSQSYGLTLAPKTEPMGMQSVCLT